MIMIKSKRLVNLLVGSIFLVSLSIKTALLPDQIAYADFDQRRGT
jgi:hypothetical protein